MTKCLVSKAKRVVEAAGSARRLASSFRGRLVEAAGIEPFSPVNPNPMMAHDFGFYNMKTFELQRRFDSPGVPYSPLESSPVLEK